MQTRTPYPCSPSVQQDVDTPTMVPVTQADHEEVEMFLRESGWLAKLKCEMFDRTIEDITQDAGLEVSKISHRHHPAAELTVTVPEGIGSDIGRARKTLFTAFQASGWPVPRRKFFMRVKRRALRVVCAPCWDAP